MLCNPSFNFLDSVVRPVNSLPEWYMLAPSDNGGGGEPTGALKADIDKTSGGLDGLKKAMVEESCRVRL